MCLFYKMYLQKYLITYKRYKNKYKIYMFTYCLYIHYLHIQNYRLFVHDSQCLTSTETTKTNRIQSLVRYKHEHRKSEWGIMYLEKNQMS